MFEMCGDNQPRLKALSAYETDLFAKLFNKLQDELSTRPRTTAKAA